MTYSNEYKGHLKCPRCGAEQKNLDEGIRPCESCGHKMVVLKETIFKARVD